MKKSLTGLVIGLVLSASAFCMPAVDPVSDKVRQSFQKEFEKATNITWMYQKDKNVYHARFQYNGEMVEAFYDEEGSLISTARFIAENQLPILVMRQMANEYPGYTVRQVVEFTNESQTTYIVSSYNSKETLVVKYYTNGDSQRIKRIKNKF